MNENKIQLVLAKAMIPNNDPIQAKSKPKNRRSLLEVAAKQPGQTKMNDYFKHSVKNEPGIGIQLL